MNKISFESPNKELSIAASFDTKLDVPPGNLPVLIDVINTQ
jgi:hypothetical protein